MTSPAPAKTPVPKPETEKKTSARGRKPGTKSKEYDLSGITPDFLLTEVPVSEQVVKATAPSKARSEIQRAADKMVLDNYKQWVEAGKPAEWAAMPKVRRDMHPRSVEGFKSLVRKAAAHHKLGVRWGSAARTKEGLQIVVFSVRDLRPREPKKPATGVQDKK